MNPDVNPPILPGSPLPAPPGTRRASPPVGPAHTLPSHRNSRVSSVAGESSDVVNPHTTTLDAGSVERTAARTAALRTRPDRLSWSDRVRMAHVQHVAGLTATDLTLDVAAYELELAEARRRLSGGIRLDVERIQRAQRIGSGSGHRNCPSPRADERADDDDFWII